VLAEDAPFGSCKSDPVRVECSTDIGFYLLIDGRGGVTPLSRL